MVEHDMRLVCQHVMDGTDFTPNEDGDCVCDRCWQVMEQYGFDFIAPMLHPLCRLCGDVMQILNKKGAEKTRPVEAGTA